MNSITKNFSIFVAVGFLLSACSKKDSPTTSAAPVSPTVQESPQPIRLSVDGNDESSVVRQDIVVTTHSGETLIIPSIRLKQSMTLDRASRLAHVDLILPEIAFIKNLKAETRISVSSEQPLEISPALVSVDSAQWVIGKGQLGFQTDGLKSGLLALQLRDELLKPLSAGGASLARAFKPEIGIEISLLDSNSTRRRVVAKLWIPIQTTWPEPPEEPQAKPEAPSEGSPAAPTIVLPAESDSSEPPKPLVPETPFVGPPMLESADRGSIDLLK